MLSEDGANGADGPVYVAVAGSMQAPRGYVVYTLRAAQVPHRARPQEIKIRDMAFLDMTACHSLWQFLARHDLVGRVVWPNAPMDDPAQAMMAEPRMLHTQDTEATWWRLVDVPRALAQRGYNQEARLVVEVHGDDLAPWNNGRWLLQATGDAGEESRVSSTELSPDITLSIRALSGLFSGMYSAQSLANWGMLSGEPDGVFAASGVFATKYEPHCPDHY